MHAFKPQAITLDFTSHRVTRVASMSSFHHHGQSYQDEIRTLSTGRSQDWAQQSEIWIGHVDAPLHLAKGDEMDRAEYTAPSYAERQVQLHRLTLPIQNSNMLVKLTDQGHHY